MILILLGVVPSCTKKQLGIPEQSIESETSAPARYSFNDFNKEQTLSTLSENDPLPVGFKKQEPVSPSNPHAKQATHLECYLGQQKIDRVIKFYIHEMERLGWRVRNFSIADEGLLVCTKKNNQRCIVARQNTDRKTKNSYKTQLLIFAKQQL